MVPKCAWCKRRLSEKQIARNNRFCSGHCASKEQFGGATSQDIAIAPGDRWEKKAPQMQYTDAVRDQQVRILYHDEVYGRGYDA